LQPKHATEGKEPPSAQQRCALEGRTLRRPQASKKVSELLLTWVRIWGPDMAAEKQKTSDPAAGLAERLAEALLQERIVPRFVDSYVVEHGRQALQVHAGMYRDLLALLQREALLAACAKLLEMASYEPQGGRLAKPRLKSRQEIAAFRRKFLAAMTRQQKWTAGDALDFQSDLQMYEQLIARAAATRRTRKPFEAANHPFVDRCAFLLDSSFLETARLAASRALSDVEKMAVVVAGTQNAGPSRTKPTTES
jgi:hypothetical protein